MSVGVVRAFKVDVSEIAGDKNTEELETDGGGPAGKDGPLEENPLAVNVGRTPGTIALADTAENPPRFAFGVKIAAGNAG